jgi:hypothetical protein
MRRPHRGRHATGSMMDLPSFWRYFSCIFSLPEYNEILYYTLEKMHSQKTKQEE